MHMIKPQIVLAKLKHKSLKDMRGFGEIKVKGDINEPVLHNIFFDLEAGEDVKQKT